MNSDLHSKAKLYEKIYSNIFKQINTNELKPGDKIPTEFEIMEKYNVSRTTAIRAIKDLEANGLISRSRKTGSFVSYTQQNNHKTKSSIIPLILPYEEQFNYDIISGAQDYALSQNCFISFFNSNNNSKKERELLLKILNMEVSSIIIYPCSLYSNIDIISKFISKGIDITFLDRKLPGMKGSLVTSNNFKSMYDLVSKIIEFGHKKIGFYAIHSNMISTETSRFDGFCHALLDNGLDINNNYILKYNDDLRHKHSNTSPESQRNITIEYIKKSLEKYLSSQDKPSCICCINDETALTMIDEYMKAGVKIPRDLSVIGFDNISSSNLGIVPLTTVMQRFYELGKLAAECAIKKINKETHGEFDTIYVPTDIIIRKSLQNIKS